MKKNSFRNLLNTFSVSKYAKWFALAPFVILLIAVIVIVALGATGGSYTNAVGIGIDFEGGSVITVTLGEDALGDQYTENRDLIVDTIQEFGVTVSYIQQQRANNVDNSSIAFRYKNISNDDDKINELNEQIRQAIDALYNNTSITISFDASAGDEPDEAEVIIKLVEIATQAGINGANAAKDDDRYVLSYKNVPVSEAELNALNQQIVEDIQAQYSGSTATIRSTKPAITYESIGATASRDLLSKAGIALAVSVALILVYIIIRFTLMSGFAAIIALIHDVVIMFALTVICRVQINSSYVAAMITIIAYSINNTIIIFDRCRESLKPLKGEKNIDYKGIGDLAVRDTMTRSVYTTLTTMITVIFLAILGSESIREFCVPIILGLIAGLYSSVFLATPLWAAMSASFDRTKLKYAKRNSITYEKKDDEEEEAPAEIAVAEVSPETEKATQSDEVKMSAPQTEKKPAQSKKSNAIYKYSKKNVGSKKK